MKQSTLIFLVSLVLLPGRVFSQFEQVFASGNVMYALETNGSKVFLGTGGEGLFRSDDKGQTWADINNEIPDWYYFSLFSSNDSLYAGSFGKVYFSSNNGETWIEIETDLGQNDFIYALNRKGNRLYAGVRDGGVYVNRIGTPVWAVVNEGLHPLVSVKDIIMLGSHLMIATNEGVYKSNENMNAWNRLDNGIPANDAFNGLYLHQGSNMLFAGSNNGIYKSADMGESWQPSFEGIGGDVDAQCFASLNDTMFVGTYSNLYISTNLGESWQRAGGNLPEEFSVYSMVTLGDLLFIGTGGGVENLVYKYKSGTLGLEAIAVERLPLLLSPNPAADYLTVEVPGRELPKQLIIYALSGEKLFTQPVTTNKQIINIGRLSPGVYHLRLEFDGYYRTAKFVKQ